MSVQQANLQQLVVLYPLSSMYAVSAPLRAAIHIAINLQRSHFAVILKGLNAGQLHMDASKVYHPCNSFFLQLSCIITASTKS